MRRLVPIAVALLVAGCGTPRTRPPDLEHAVAPDAFVTVPLGATGIRFSRPGNWDGLTADNLLIGGARSNTATVAVWRYPRTEPLPHDTAGLEAAQTALVDRIRQRNPTFVLHSSEVTRIGGARGIELTGTQTVSGFQYDVRSAHLFQDGAEIVVDAFAPTADFPRVDATVFQPVLDRLEVGRP